jgi:DNA-binding winged helix-turn-helix (wHTH) protein
VCETAYQIGRFTLLPFRELLDGPKPSPIGRKPLEILSVLAEHGGALVTKDELMAAVWPQVIVEDNAVQAHIAALRKILGSDARLLTTARGRGYRLAAKRIQAEALPGAAPKTKSGRRFGQLIPALIAVLAIGGVAVAGWQVVRGWATAAPALRPRVAVGAFSSAHGDPAETALAAAMNTEVAEALSHYDVIVFTPRPGPGTPAPGTDFTVRGLVSRTADGFSVTTDLSDTRSNVLVYSFETSQPRGAGADASAAIASHVALSLDPSKLTNDLDGKLTPEDYTTVARFNDALDKSDTPGDAFPLSSAYGQTAASPEEVERAQTLFDQAQKLAERHPHDGDLQAAVAFAAVWVAQAEPSRDDRMRDLERARRAIRRAASLSPDSALAVLAKVLLLNGPLSRAAHEQAERRALQINPRQHIAYNGLGETLIGVGRTREGVGLIKRSVELDPMSRVVVGDGVWALIAAGSAEDASRLMAREQLIWPSALETRYHEMGMAYYLGDPGKVAAVVSKYGPPPPIGIDPAHLDVMLGAWRTRNPAQIRRMAANCFADYGKSAVIGQAVDMDCLFVMVRVGDLDDAFRFAALAFPDCRNLYRADADEWITRPRLGLDPSWLFSPIMAPLRADPRFWDIAVRTGLVDYWQTTGSWPDFCAPQLDRCKRLASDAALAHPARPAPRRA